MFTTLYTFSPLFRSPRFRHSPRVKEEDTQLSLEFDVPGVSLEEISVETELGLLQIEIQRARRPLPKGAEWRIQERSVAPWTRRFSLPPAVEGAEVEASVERGILTITLPKAKNAQARKIEVKAS